MLKRIAVMTTGGDAPGMNAAIRAVVRHGIHGGLEVFGVMRGYRGLVEGELVPMDHRSVSNIINQGGTILKTARCPEFRTPEGQERAFRTLTENRIDAMVVIGGNGSFQGGHEFFKRYKVPLIGIPASIDNDINGIDLTIGSDTAVNTALSAIDNIRDTATSMERVFVVEVMGRDSGFIALQVALAGGCEEVLIPEMDYDIGTICQEIKEGNSRGKISWILVVAEGVASAPVIAEKITEMAGVETRQVVLGHIQRGGRPTAFSRTMGLTLGHAAVGALLRGEKDQAVSVRNGKVATVDLEVAVQKKVLDVETVYALIKKMT